MSRDVEELKGKMMATAEEVIDNLLAGVSRKDALMLSDIERSVRAAGQRMMRDLTQELVDGEADERQEGVCGGCGERARGKGKKERRLATETGDVKLSRDYYYCPRCKEGFFPPGSTMGAEGECIQSGASPADGMDQ